MSFSIVFPGQGSQSIGMMGELAAKHSLVKDLFVEASDILGVDMWAMTQEGPIEALSQTCLLYTSPSPRDKRQSRMPSSA